MKKWMYLVITCLSLTLIGYSVMAYANDTPTGSSKEVKGIFVALDSQNQIQIQTDSGTETVALAKSVWVYRNNQKANLNDLKIKDQLELILNSKMQAAYIKAISPDAASSSPSPSPETAPASTPTPLPAGTATPPPAPAATVAPEPTSTPVPSAAVPSAEVNSNANARVTVTLNPSKGNENEDNDHEDAKKHEDNKPGKAVKKSDHGEKHGHRAGDD